MIRGRRPLQSPLDRSLYHSYHCSSLRSCPRPPDRTVLVLRTVPLEGWGRRLSCPGSQASLTLSKSSDSVAPLLLGESIRPRRLGELGLIFSELLESAIVC